MNNESFLKHYRTDKQAVWTKCRLTDGREYYFAKYDTWKMIKAYCEKNKSFIEEFSLQFRSHEVNIDIPEDIDGLYYVRSVLGKIGGATNEYLTVGLVRGENVSKQMWMIPELVVDKTFEEGINECFAEAIIYNEKKKKNREE